MGGVWANEAILFLFKGGERGCAVGLCFFLSSDLEDEGEGDEEGKLYFLPCTLPFTT